MKSLYEIYHEISATVERLDKSYTEASKTWTRALSPREIEVLQLVSEGLSNKDIGDVLLISPLTVKHHLHNIGIVFGGVSRREVMVMEALRAGVIV